ncbi:hypothetical protein KIL84_016410 [Mauremys mutica]|uniref:Uncharacterized protein n=1 Tax=Mauremys mutica TaxID=74926 RepID=A0A9D3X477_9SAUR|nr:hypothetical protein KIL84_016410 [Mauremys mutica]
MTPVIGVIVIVEITCQLPIAVALVPLTNSDRGEGFSTRPPDDFSSDNKECRASDNLPVTVECSSERVGQIVVIHFDKDSKMLWCRRRIIKINEIAYTSFVWRGVFWSEIAQLYMRVVKLAYISSCYCYLCFWGAGVSPKAVEICFLIKEYTQRQWIETKFTFSIISGNDCFFLSKLIFFFKLFSSLD